VNGRALLSEDASLLARFASEKRTPKLVIQVQVEDAYLHCAKALMRSKLWSAESRVERTVLPTMGQMLNDQTGGSVPAESQENMVERYQADL
jgi:predicted pyridoxine 5'-phosphate oxidase superfamily flavin-nucleotide-binding protein